MSIACSSVSTASGRCARVASASSKLDAATRYAERTAAFPPAWRRYRTALLQTSPRIKALTGDILFTYLLNPGTALYVGYTDRYENLGVDPTLPFALRLQRIGQPTTPTGRQFFVKLSYLLRF